MAGEPQIDEGPFAACQAAQSVANGAWNTQNPSAISAVLSGVYQKAPLLDFRIECSSGTPAENGVVEVHRMRGDGTNSAPLPSAYTGATFVGSAIFDNAAGSFAFIDGVASVSINDKFVLKNISAGTVTLALAVRGRGLTSA